jgi:hypothetical protein
VLIELLNCTSPVEGVSVAAARLLAIMTPTTTAIVTSKMNANIPPIRPPITGGSSQIDMSLSCAAESGVTTAPAVPASLFVDEIVDLEPDPLPFVLLPMLDVLAGLFVFAMSVAVAVAVIGFGAFDVVVVVVVVVVVFVVVGLNPVPVASMVDDPFTVVVAVSAGGRLGQSFRWHIIDTLAKQLLSLPTNTGRGRDVQQRHNGAIRVGANGVATQAHAISLARDWRVVWKAER